MKIIEIHQKENVSNLTYDFLIVFLGLKYRKILTHEQLVISKILPLWLRISKWLLQKTCGHRWEKEGNPKMEGYFLGDKLSTMVQTVKCKNCGKENYYKYKSGIDTSF